MNEIEARPTQNFKAFSNSNVTLVLLRHCSSGFNDENRFTGWLDIPLSESGCQESLKVAQKFKENEFQFDIVFTSLLSRTIKTAWILLEELNLMWIPIFKCWQLNERMYGILQGQNKVEAKHKYGEKQLDDWRRTFNLAPPPLNEESPLFTGNDRRYVGLIPKSQIPHTESLKDVMNRLIPYYEEHIQPYLKQKQHALVVSHSNALRGLVKHLENISDEDIVHVNIPVGIPLVYVLDSSSLQIKERFYLASKRKVEEGIEAVKNQTKKQT